MIDANNTTLHQVEQFRKFVLNQFKPGEQSPSLDELFDQWRLNNPMEEESNSDLVAIAASLRDLESGRVGRTIVEFFDDFKNERGLGS